MIKQTTIVFAGGGTGGHLFPGIAVAEALLRHDPHARLLFAGSERDVERSIIARSGFAHLPLPAVPSSMWKRNPFGFAWNNWRALRAARRLLATERPAAVVGLGGFASVPVVVAASSAGVPVLLLEQNLVPGRATRWLKRRADLICVSFDETVARLGNLPSVRVTGNPLRRAIADLCAADFSTGVPADSAALQTAPEMTNTMLVLGGSQGSSAVNAAVLGAVEKLHDSLRGWKIVHQTGCDEADQTRAEYARLSISAIVEPFLDDMPAQYRAATLVVSRSGATTLTELACAGIPAVLIPYPNAIGDHQTHNARAFEKAGAARVIPQQNDAALTAAALSDALQPLLANAAARDTMRSGMRSLARPQAAADVANLILDLTR